VDISTMIINALPPNFIEAFDITLVRRDGVARAALRTLKREEQRYEAKPDAPRAAIDEGDRGEIAEGKVFARVRKRLQLADAAALALVARLRFSRRAKTDFVQYR
jgi:hypothetical protein